MTDPKETPMPDQTTEPRLGAALIFGATAEHCVHVHTGPAGIAAILGALNDLDTEPREGTVPVVAVLGIASASPTGLADRYEVDIPRDAVDDLARLAKGLNRPAVDR